MKRVKRDKAEQHKAKIEKDRKRREFLKELLSNLPEYVAEGKAHVKYLTSIRDDLKRKAINQFFHDAYETLFGNQSNNTIKRSVVMQVEEYESK